jgi:lipoprotein-anchoring transpeptidase ErfK/SrfK
MRLTMNPTSNVVRRVLGIVVVFSTVAVMVPLSAFAETFTKGKQVPPTTEKLTTGDFVWEPERAPAGPVLIVVSVPEQVAYVYRNGIRIARTSVSTGRPGHPTPTGVFDILEKEKDHVSTIYKGAEMPWMERLTWTGIAMHAGDLPGYPDSHGCVRLPLEFSKLLFTVTTKGGTVIIADETSALRETVHPGMMFSQVTPPSADTPLTPGGFTWTPEKSASGPLTILVSEPDKVVYVYRNGVEIGRSTIQSVGIKGLHIFSALEGRDEQGRSKWIRVDGKPAANDPNIADMAQKSGIAQEFIIGVRSVVIPGTTLVFTDQPVNTSTQSKPGFKILGVGVVAKN